MAVVTEARDGYGPLPLGFPELASPVVQTTSNEDIAIKHKLLFFTVP